MRTASKESGEVPITDATSPTTTLPRPINWIKESLNISTCVHIIAK